jgi:hypothetical protein
VKLCRFPLIIQHLGLINKPLDHFNRISNKLSVLENGHTHTDRLMRFYTLILLFSLLSMAYADAIKGVQAASSLLIAQDSSEINCNSDCSPGHRGSGR